MQSTISSYCLLSGILVYFPDNELEINWLTVHIIQHCIVYIGVEIKQYIFYYIETFFLIFN
jgi:predicted membrane-bound mannosyltransferase